MDKRINPEKQATVKIDGINYQMTYNEVLQTSQGELKHIGEGLHNIDDPETSSNIIQDAYEALNEAGASQWMDLPAAELPF